MYSADAWKERTRVESVFALVEQVPPEQVELRSHFARYLCVLVSGYVEVAVAAILRDYAQARGDRRIAGYVASQLEWFTNPNGEKLASLLAEFDVVWRNRMLESITPEQGDALTSIHSIRNLVAHGRSTDVTLLRAREYAKAAYGVIEVIDRLCHESPRD